jgi:Protein of unknown function (DUF4232)
VNLRIVVVGLGLASLAAACGSGSSGGSPEQSNSPTGPPATPSATQSASSPNPVPKTTASTEPPSSSSPAPTVTVTRTVPATVTTCRSTNLRLSLGPSDGAAGTIYQEIVFTNRGTVPCTLRGYPGVSYVNAAGAIIGRPTTEDPGRRVTVLLAVNGRTHALLRQPDAGNFSPQRCQLTTADRLQVYPPGETQPLFVVSRTQVCASGIGRGGIGPVRPGVGNP